MNQQQSPKNKDENIRTTAVTTMTARSSSSSPSAKKQTYQPVIKRETTIITGWPTDTVSIDIIAAADDDDGHHSPSSLSSSSLLPPRPITSLSSSPSPPPPSSSSSRPPSHIIFFIPGNPGCIEWYNSFLSDILKHVGPDFCIRGISYAGHGFRDDIVRHTDDDDDNAADETEAKRRQRRPRRRTRRRNSHLSWSVSGQMEHKIAWIDNVLDHHYHRLSKATTATTINNNDQSPSSPPPPPKLIFLTHSFGAHLVQKLSLLRRDILQLTLGHVHLMPFFRFDPPSSLFQHLPATLMARNPALFISLLKVASGTVVKNLPPKLLDWALRELYGVEDEEGRRLAMAMVGLPEMMGNFLTLGLDEIRVVPETFDDATFRIIGRHNCPTKMLYCGGPDHWAPRDHIDDLKKLQHCGRMPTNIAVEYRDELRHGFIVFPDMVAPVVDFCVRAIEELSPREEGRRDLEEEDEEGDLLGGDETVTPLLRSRL